MAIDVIGHNQSYRDYLDALCNATGKYGFDANQEMFLNIYRDTVLKLDERGYLFEDNPELVAIQREMKGLPQIDSTVPHTATLDSISITTEDMIRPISHELIPPENIKADDLPSDPESESVRIRNPTHGLGWWIWISQIAFS